jgi:predicted adenylyl cyclase CyaB
VADDPCSFWLLCDPKEQSSAGRVAAIGAPRRNLELKARDRHPGRSPLICEEIGAEDRGTLIQRDTYFDVPQGRLKLRDVEGAASHLIAYERADIPGQRESRYRIVPVEDAAELREALSSVLGVLVVVEKARRLFVFDGVRIHLDRVDGLGDFIEFEGVIGSGERDGPERSQELLTELRSAFGIRDDVLLAESYSDLALASART